MQFVPMDIADVWLVRPQRLADPRGSFARSFCAAEFAAHGLPMEFVQCSVSRNACAGTLRGLHWQPEPCAEAKLVRCSRGAIFDVAVDLRPGSPTHQRWVSAELSGENGDALFIPPGVAHGFQTLQDDSEVFYQMTAPYHDGMGCGLRWDDPTLGIPWPLPDPLLSARDAALPILAGPLTVG